MQIMINFFDKFWQSMIGLLKNPFILPALFAFFLVSNLILHSSVSLINYFGDAADIWQTISSYYDKNTKPSYVLYKGMLSVYPYVWLYKIPNLVNNDPFFYIKLYHALLFSYVGAVGIPITISKLFNVKITLLRNLVYVFILYWGTAQSGVFSGLMIDLPMWAIFVSAVSFSLVVTNNPKFQNKPCLLVSGLLAGLCICGSGQYFFAGICVIVYMIIWLVTHKLVRLNTGLAVTLIIVYVFGVASSKGADLYFTKAVVQPMRAAGAWIPTSSDWVNRGLQGGLLVIRGFKQPRENVRGISILKKTEGSNYDNYFSGWVQGAYGYDKSTYIKILFQNIFDVVIMWAAKAFLALSIDGEGGQISHLFVSYTIFYFSLYVLFSKVKTYASLIYKETLIFLAFLSLFIAPIIFHWEYRYMVAVYSFFLGITVFQLNIRKKTERVNDIKAQYSVSSFFELLVLYGKENYNKMLNTKISYQAICYIFFMLFSFVIYASYVEQYGPDPSTVLFKW